MNLPTKEDRPRKRRYYPAAIYGLKRGVAAEAVKTVLRYEPETGDLYWIAGRYPGQKAGCLHYDGYVYISLNNKCYKAHRLAWVLAYGEFPVSDIDHLNGMRADNRLSNLRLLTNAQNQQNRFKARSDSKTGIIGVKKDGKNFSASIKVQGKRIHIGTFKTPEEASAAYLNAKRELHPYAPATSIPNAGGQTDG